MGEVYRALDSRLGRTVAIKILPTHLLDNAEAKQGGHECADAIDANPTLDSDKFALSRLKKELVAILDRHEEKVESFQTSVQAALEDRNARQRASECDPSRIRDVRTGIWVV